MIDFDLGLDTQIHMLTVTRITQRALPRSLQEVRKRPHVVKSPSCQNPVGEKGAKEQSGQRVGGTNDSVSAAISCLGAGVRMIELGSVLVFEVSGLS